MDNVQKVNGWTEGKFLMEASRYAGRGPDKSCLDSKILEMLRRGIKLNIGIEQAANFVRFVNKLDDLSPSHFVAAFDWFLDNKCMNIVFPQKRNNDPYEHVNNEAAGFALFAKALTGQTKQSPEDIRKASDRLKYDFIKNNLGDIPQDEWRQIAAPLGTS